MEAVKLDELQSNQHVMFLRIFFVGFFLLVSAVPRLSTVLAQDINREVLEYKFRTYKNDTLVRFMDTLYRYEARLPFEKSIVHAEEVVKIAKEAGIQEPIVQAYSSLAYLYFEKKRIDEAFENFRNASIEARTAQPYIKAWIALHTGYFYKSIDLLPEAEEQLVEAVQLYDSVGDVRMLFRSNYFLSIVYYFQNKYTLSITTGKKAIDDFKIVKDPERQDSTEYISAHNTIGLCYYFFGDLDKALKWFGAAEDLSRKFKSEIWVAITRGNRGKAYVQMGRLEEALEEYRYKFSVSKDLNELSDACNDATSIAQVLTLMKRYPAAEAYLDTAKSLLRYSKEYTIRLLYWETRTEFYKTQGKFKEAISMLKQVNFVRDSVYQARERASYERDATRQKIETKDAEINLLKARNEIFVLEASRNNIQRNVLIASILTFIALIIVIYIAYRNKMRSNQALMVKNEAIERHQKELAVSLENLKNAQEQLVQSEKMVSLGQLTAGIVHEINNPLNFISGGVEALKNEIHDLKLFSGLTNEEKTIHSLLHTISSGVQRISKITTSLLLFAGPQKYELEDVNIHEPLEAAITILGSKIREGQIQVVKDYGELPLIAASSIQLSQVFLNIIDNAIYFLCKIDGDRILRITTGRKGEQIRISIADNGPGIPLRIQKQIMDPFFTTKEVGKGTGLGLSISLGIINNHQGSLHTVSEEGKGADFIVCLPVRTVHEKSELVQ